MEIRTVKHNGTTERWEYLMTEQWKLPKKDRLTTNGWATKEDDPEGRTYCLPDFKFFDGSGTYGAAHAKQLKDIIRREHLQGIERPMEEVNAAFEKLGLPIEKAPRAKRASKDRRGLELLADALFEVMPYVPHELNSYKTAMDLIETVLVKRSA